MKQILDKKSTKFENLEKLNRIRNLFGHGSLNLHSGQGTPNEEWYLNDPKKAEEVIDPTTLKNDFNQLYFSITEWLITESKVKGIPYP